MKACAIVCTNNPAVVDTVSGALDDCGPRLLVCRSSLEVLGTSQVVDADVLILDLETPGLNGLLLISAIKELAPGLCIVVVSMKPHPDARAVSSAGVSYVPLTSRSSGGEILSNEVARLRRERTRLGRRREGMTEMGTDRERHQVLRGLLEHCRREVQAKLLSLRRALPGEVAEVKDAEEHGLDDVMREVDFVLLQMKSETLRQIGEAIGRLESSTYGACVECGRDIAEGRLRALPFVRLCRACQEKEESREAAQRVARLRGPLLEGLVTVASVRGERVWSGPRGADFAESTTRQSRRVGARATARSTRPNLPFQAGGG